MNIFWFGHTCFLITAAMGGGREISLTKETLAVHTGVIVLDTP